MTDEKNTEKDMELNTEEVKSQEGAAEGQENAAEAKDNAAAPGEAAEEAAPEQDPLEVAQAEIADLKKQLLYKIAEFDNYRKRTMSEKADVITLDGSTVISGFAKTLKQMGKLRSGSKAIGMFYSELGYGYSGSSSIPGYAPLIFEIEFVDKPEE